MVRLRILKSFKYGSISDPQKMIAGNTVEMEVNEKRLAKWIEIKWVEVVE